MFFVGLDLGQKQDFSAVAVAERTEDARAWLSPEARGMRVRYLERMPLGTAYVDVVGRVNKIMEHPALLQNGRLVVDATGVGAPVVEMLRAARPVWRVTAVTIISGEHAHGRGEEWHVPKKDLMAGLQVLLEDGQLKIHRKLREAATLVRELTDIRLSPRNGGRVGMGAGGYGEHDDLALSGGAGVLAGSEEGDWIWDSTFDLNGGQSSVAGGQFWKGGGMSVEGYLGMRTVELRLEGGDVPARVE